MPYPKLPLYFTFTFRFAWVARPLKRVPTTKLRISSDPGLSDNADLVRMSMVPLFADSVAIPLAVNKCSVMTCQLRQMLGKPISWSNLRINFYISSIDFFSQRQPDAITQVAIQQ